MFEYNITLTGLVGLLSMEMVEIIPLTLIMPQISTQTAIELIDLGLKGIVALATVYAIYKKTRDK